MAKVQLGVIFGSRSCEREVSIISAVQLMNHAASRRTRPLTRTKRASKPLRWT